MLKSILLKTVLTDILQKGRQNGYHFEPNDPSEEAIHISYTELHQSLKWQTSYVTGRKKGDRLYLLPMIPELAIATLACARIGAIHSVVFAGFQPRP
jgi:acetyl-CoA synthetase